MFAHSSIRALAGIGLAAVLLSACSGPPAIPTSGAHPADPAAPSRPVAYRNVIGGAVMRPVDPSDWRNSNDSVAPGEKP
jgi:hypothetical protein